MAYSDSVVHRARQRLAEAKSRHEAEYEAHKAIAYRAYPRLREIDMALRQTVAAAVSASLAHGEDTSAAIDALRQKNLRLQEERQWILDASDLEEDFLNDAPICASCGGSGYVGARMCECLQELCRQEQKRELAPLFPTGRESFDNFSLGVYPEEHDPTLGTSPRRMMQRNLAICKKYAAGFSEGAGNLLFSGATGLGKTFLSACIARQISDSGFSVVYVSAGTLFTEFEAVRFSGADPSGTKKYMDCDLLIIDDLGTELTTQFAISALYNIINSRLTVRKSTIISTNLSPDLLEGRYSPQIASRLLGAYQLIPFVGADIRTGSRKA